MSGSARVSFKTVGCRLNQAETAQMAAQFDAAGYHVVSFGRPCEICVVHTCAITEHAQKTCLRIARSLKRLSNPPVVALAGCAVETDRVRIQKESGADIVAGQQEKFRLPELLSQALNLKSSNPNLSPNPNSQSPNPIPHFETRRALVKVQDGCDFHCAYCIVPLARGAARSRPSAEIIAEITRLGDMGYREVSLTGANLGCYQDESLRLVGLIRKVEGIRSIERIRLSSIELSTTERDVIDHIADSEKLCAYIHFPLQSGDNAILAAMGRRYTVEQYARTIEYAAKKIPTIGLGADIIVGFPGETETAFQNTVAVVNDLPFSKLHVFPYSRRDGTRAADMRNQVAPAEKKRRTSFLIELGEMKRRAFAQKFIGRKVSVLLEQTHPDGTGIGWTMEYVEAKLKNGGLQPNRIVDFIPSSYYDGKLI